MRKPSLCIHATKKACDQCLCFRYIDRTIPLHHTSTISNTSHLLWLYSSVCVGPGRKHRRQGFLRRGSYDKLKKQQQTRFDVYETLCPQQMLVHKGGQIKNWSGEYRDIIPTKLQRQAIQRALQSPNLQREIIPKK